MRNPKLVFFVGVAIIAALVIAAQNYLAAPALRDLGNLALVREIADGSADCSSMTFSASTPYLQAALTKQSDDRLTWAMLLKIKGITDRPWIVQQMDRDESTHQMIAAAKVDLDPTGLTSRYSWGYIRCQSVYAAWTRGLIEAVDKQWSVAVAAYQAGLGLALGRTPDSIFKEYYFALGNELNAAPIQSPEQSLAAAKYLALGGATADALTLFSRLATDARLTPQGRCDAKLGKEWLQAGSGAGTPPWPNQFSSDGVCSVSGEAEPTPEWSVKPNPALTQMNKGMTLLGFDIDHDVLAAGAQVLGVMYWQKPDGTIVDQRFRQANYWPNSGNNWQSFGKAWACLPGYLEPSWVQPCASRAEIDSSSAGNPNPVGDLRERREDGPDSLLQTATMKLPSGKFMAFGGRWRLEGDLPDPHVPRILAGRQPPNDYTVVLDLANYQPGKWTKLATVVSPISDGPKGSEAEYWIRPRAGKGSGEIWFDDLFNFVVEPFAQSSPG